MSLEKEWVEDFEILENNGVIGINMQLKDEPIDTATLVYDGRNSAILIRNEKKAYILTNLVSEVRDKIANSKEILIIESDGEEVVNSYTCGVSIVPEIPIEDTIPETLGEMLANIKEAFGDEGCVALARKFWGIK